MSCKLRLPVPIAGDAAGVTSLQYDMKLAKNPGDCGIDLYPQARGEDDLIWTTLGFYKVVSIPTRVSILVPDGYFAWITGRSSSIDKLMGCQVVPGIIDHGYTGEYRIRVAVPEVEIALTRVGLLVNLILQHSREQVALAQAILIPYVQAGFVAHLELPVVDGRGSDGYGSTDGKMGRHGRTQDREDGKMGRQQVGGTPLHYTTEESNQLYEEGKLPGAKDRELDEIRPYGSDHIIL